MMMRGTRNARGVCKSAPAHDRLTLPCVTPPVGLGRVAEQETKNALEEDDNTLEQKMDQVVTQSMQLERELNVKLNAGAKKGGRVKLGAGAPGSVPLPTKDEAAAVQDKKLEAGTLSGIAALRKQLAAITTAHAHCDEIIAMRFLT